MESWRTGLKPRSLLGTKGVLLTTVLHSPGEPVFVFF